MAEKFTHQVCKQLDKNVEQLEPELSAKLAAARRAALAPQPEPKRPTWRVFSPVVYWPALAAALLAIVILPSLTVPTHAPIEPSLDAHSLYDVEPELLETMDLLWAVEDLAEREMRAL
ncbi:DUF3619 family protein [Simiduia curdlanivorans]|uniref:DUF3619 family protein n=1 Tax=Simiduia curdlanivorans TaxID=1492769 RepID=A0ABV8V421_9GAMM|nr:DUF3619 family protein [Simiduia curdlanivorans]MDN3640130.1 DUF3619 family protein [Simiduia curdlanivorans]